MENKPTTNKTRNNEGITHDITVLEDQIKAVKNKLNQLENEAKLEIHKQNHLEVKKNILIQNIEFYKSKAMDAREKFVEKTTTHSKFSMADQCYDRLLETYKENYLQSWIPRTHPCAKASQAWSNILGQQQIEVLQKQLQLLQAKIDQNTVNITNLLHSFGQMSD